jgi:hypothetical protein
MVVVDFFELHLTINLIKKIKNYHIFCYDLIYHQRNLKYNL